MNSPENYPPGSAEETDLRQTVAKLQRQNCFLLIGLTVASLTLTAYLALISRRSANELENGRQNKAKLMEMSRNVQNIVMKLGEYGQSHADFSAILAKYGIKVTPNPPTVAPGTPTLRK
jgi:hypothetical protein